MYIAVYETSMRGRKHATSYERSNYYGVGT